MPPTIPTQSRPLLTSYIGPALETYLEFAAFCRRYVRNTTETLTKFYFNPPSSNIKRYISIRKSTEYESCWYLLWETLLRPSTWFFFYSLEAPIEAGRLSRGWECFLVLVQQQL